MEKKTVQIKTRITPTEKEKLDKYCEDNELIISDLIRIALNKMVNQEEK